jgi:hypothetical protein
MLTEVQRDEGRGAAEDGGRHRVIICGSRTWGEPVDSNGNERPPAWVNHELEIGARVLTRLIDRWVIGIDEKFGTRQRGVEDGPGLTVILGGAAGADKHAENGVRIASAGLSRRSRAEKEWFDEHVAPEFATKTGELGKGFFLEVYPADWSQGRGAGHARNQQMADRQPHEVIALYAHGRHYDRYGPGGTNDMVRRALKIGATVWTYEAGRGQWKQR